MLWKLDKTSWIYSVKACCKSASAISKQYKCSPIKYYSSKKYVFCTLTRKDWLFRLSWLVLRAQICRQTCKQTYKVVLRAKICKLLTLIIYQPRQSGIGFTLFLWHSVPVCTAAKNVQMILLQLHRKWLNWHNFTENMQWIWASLIVYCFILFLSIFIVCTFFWTFLLFVLYFWTFLLFLLYFRTFLLFVLFSGNFYYF